MIEARPWDDPDGAALRKEQRVELDARYGRDDHEPGPLPSAADIDHFLVAVDPATGVALGCGALRQLFGVYVGPAVSVCYERVLI